MKYAAASAVKNKCGGAPLRTGGAKGHRVQCRIIKIDDFSSEEACCKDDGRSDSSSSDG